MSSVTESFQTCMCVQARAKDAEHEEEIMQIKQKVGQDQRFFFLNLHSFSFAV